MKVVKSHAKELLVLTILLAIAVSVVNAAVFVYYPIDISAGWQNIEVYFTTDYRGNNAGKADLGSQNIIIVKLDRKDPPANGTSAYIEVHPCRMQTTYYRDIMRIANNGSQAYYIGFIVKTPFSDNAISVAELIIKDTSGKTVGTVNLKSTGTTWTLEKLNSNSQFVVDLEFTISSSSSGSDSASISLVYSPQSGESPPSP